MGRRRTRDAGFASLFEEDYLLRTLGRIAHDPDVALTELVANAWDAGAAKVDITIPDEKGCILVVEDDGHGMTPEQFKARWMTLAYDRIRHQGKDVEFPEERNDWKRRPYGRNGVGRHGLLCFADRYMVETRRDGAGTRFVVTTHSQETPFRIESHAAFRKAGHGTRLSVEVARHLPDPARIRNILSARFLHDPQFVVKVNGQSVSLAEQPGLVEQATLEVGDGLAVEAFVVDSTKAAASTLYQGIAFWVNRRLVGTPSWVVGNRAVLDGRARFAKRFAIVINAGDEWISHVEQDWSGFRRTDEAALLYDKVCAYAAAAFERFSARFVEETSEDALMRNREQFRKLSELGRIEVASFAHELARRSPTIQTETLSAAVQAVISLERSRSGAALLDKLTKLDEEDIEGLDRMLGQWTVRDALSVLDEIDHRLGVIAAIEKLSGDAHADELHTLHPLVTHARWIFGPEFDSHEYASNVSLRTAAETVFGKRVDRSAFVNPDRRPDIMCLADATVSVVGTETLDPEQQLAKIDNVLIIELKKGGKDIGRDEMNQADGYVQDFMCSGALDGTPLFRAFVVGHKIAPKTSREKEIREEGVLRGRVIGTTCGQLVRTANARLFRLRERIPARYDGISGADLMARVMGRESQAELSFADADRREDNTPP